MVSASDYVSGASIQWGRLGLSLVGATILAYFRGIVEAFLSLADIPIALLSGLADFAGELVTLVAGFPAVIVRGSWRGAIEYVTSAGIAGYVLAIAVVLLSTYFVAEVVSRVR